MIRSAYACFVRGFSIGRVFYFAAALALTFGAAPSDAQSSAPHFHVASTSKIGGEGSWDYLEYEEATDRLFIARVGGVLVVDAHDMRAVGTVPAFAGTRVHGIALASDLGVGMTSDGHDETATVFDLATLKALRRVPLNHAPDAILYDSVSQKGVAFDGDDNVAVAFDPKTGKVFAEVKLPGSPEAAVSDGDGHVYVNLSDKNEIAAIDTRTWAVDQHWVIGGACEDPTPLALDRTSHRLFSGCRSGVLAVVDPTKKQLVETLPIGKGADSVAYDPGSGLIFVACYDGTLTVAKGVSPSHYEVVDT